MKTYVTAILLALAAMGGAQAQSFDGSGEDPFGKRRETSIHDETRCLAPGVKVGDVLRHDGRYYAVVAFGGAVNPGIAAVNVATFLFGGVYIQRTCKSAAHPVLATVRAVDTFPAEEQAKYNSIIAERLKGRPEVLSGFDQISDRPAEYDRMMEAVYAGTGAVVAEQKTIPLAGSEQAIPLTSELGTAINTQLRSE